MRVIALPVLFLFAPCSAAAQGVPLTLDRAVEILLDRNIEIRAARAEVQRAQAESVAAGVRPNPVLTVTAENLTLGGPERPVSGSLREVSAVYQDTVELGGKREHRQSVARQAVSVAEARYQGVAREQTILLKKSYSRALLARHNLDIEDENRRTFESLVRFNLARFEEGAVAEGDLLKVRLERMKIEAAVGRAELELAHAMIALLEKLEESDLRPRPIEGNLETPLIRLDLERMKQLGLENRMDLRASQAGVQFARSRLALEQAQSLPDISPFAGYKSVAGKKTVLFGVSIPLSIRDRNQGGIARAVADEALARARLDVAEHRVRVEVEAAFQSVQSVQDQVIVFRDELLRQADESQTITLAAYEEGATELLPVLEAQRTRSAIRQQYFQTLFDYRTSLIELERALGREIQP